MNEVKQEHPGVAGEGGVKKTISPDRRLSVAPMMDWT
jgi:hypothetical protein